jgi:hypothetical protein
MSENLRKYCHVIWGMSIRWGLDWMSRFIALIDSTRNYKQYSAITDIHTSQFNVTPTSVLTLLQSH